MNLSSQIVETVRRAIVSCPPKTGQAIDALLAKVGAAIATLLENAWVFSPDAALRPATPPNIEVERYASTMSASLSAEAADELAVIGVRKRILKSVAAISDETENEANEVFESGIPCLPPFTRLGTPTGLVSKFVKRQLVVDTQSSPTATMEPFEFRNYLALGVFELESVHIPCWGLLHDVQKAALKLVDDYGWQLGEANTFILCGVAPPYHPAICGFVNVSPIPVRSRIILVLDPELSAKEVSAIYTSVRREVVPSKRSKGGGLSRARRLSAENADLVADVSSSLGPDAMACRLTGALIELTDRLADSQKKSLSTLQQELISPSYPKRGQISDYYQEEIEIARKRNANIVEDLNVKLREWGTSYDELTALKLANLRPNSIWFQALTWMNGRPQVKAAWHDLKSALEAKDRDLFLASTEQLTMLGHIQVQDYGALTRAKGWFENAAVYLETMDAQARDKGFESSDQIVDLWGSMYAADDKGRELWRAFIEPGKAKNVET